MRKKNNSLLLHLDSIPTFEEFSAQMKVSPNGFGSIVLRYVYRNIFIDSDDLLEEYNKYYSVEYQTFYAFLSKKIGVEIAATEIEAKHILRVDPWFTLLDPIYDNNFLEMIIGHLGVHREN